MKTLEEQKTAELKDLKTLKGITSGKFKHLQKGTTEYFEKLAVMKEISEKITAVEKEIKSIRHTSIASKHPEQPTSTSPFPQLDKNKYWGTDFEITLHSYNQVPEWNDFVASNSAQLPSHNPAWINLIQTTFGHQSFILCARTSTGKLVGGLPLTVFSSPLFGKFPVSMPYLNYGGPITEYYDVCMSLMQSLNGARKELDLKYIEIRSIYDDIQVDPSTKKASMVLRLPNDDVELDRILGSKVRAQYKRAEDYDPITKFGKIELLEDFYKVFSCNMRDLGTPVYSKKWFENILNNNKLDAHLIVIYVHNKPVSCGFLVNHGSLMEIPWASTLKSANKYNTNMWMYRKILSFAIQKGCKYFDFGRSTIEAGTYKFKKQWGAEPYQNYWYSILPPDTPKPELNPDNPKLKLFINIWKIMPVWIANLIGPFIIKNIP